MRRKLIYLCICYFMVILFIGCHSVDKPKKVQKLQQKIQVLSVEETVKRYVSAITNHKYKEAWGFLSEHEKQEYAYDEYWARYGRHRSSIYTTSYTIKHIDYFDDGTPTAYVYIKFNNHFGESDLTFWKEKGLWKLYYGKI